MAPLGPAISPFNTRIDCPSKSQGALYCQVTPYLKCPSHTGRRTESRMSATAAVPSASAEISARCSGGWPSFAFPRSG